MTLRVTVQIIPFGEEDKSYLIRQLDIFNMGYVEFGHCEYGVIEILPERNEAGLYIKTVIHRRDLGDAKLIQKVLEMVNSS